MEINRDKFYEFVLNMLEKSISNDYTGCIVDNILDDVIDDVKTSADENWNEDDVRLAIGRVLIERLVLEK